MMTDLGDPNRADRIRHRGSLRDQDIHLAQLGNDLFGGVSLLAHRDPPSASKPYFRMDHSKGGGSGPLSKNWNCTTLMWSGCGHGGSGSGAFSRFFKAEFGLVN